MSNWQVLLLLFALTGIFWLFCLLIEKALSAIELKINNMRVDRMITWTGTDRYQWGEPYQRE